MSAEPSPSFTVTLFPNQFAHQKAEQTFTPRELATAIKASSGESKQALPWLKLARFGDRRNPDKPKSRSLRFNANVLALSGLEADYDGGLLSVETAMHLLAESGLTAIIYTSASHTPEAPRFRVLCPFAREYTGTQQELQTLRDRFMSRLNGLFGGVFSRESWVLSQSYYYGQVGENPGFQVALTEGFPLDHAADLDASAINRPRPHRAERPKSSFTPAPPTDVDEKRARGMVGRLLDNIRIAGEGQKHPELFRHGRTIGGYLHYLGWTKEEGVAQMIQALPPTVKDWAQAKQTAHDALRIGMRDLLKLPPQEEGYEPRRSNGNGNGHDRSAPPWDEDDPGPEAAGPRPNGSGNGNGQEPPHDPGPGPDPEPQPQEKKKRARAPAPATNLLALATHIRSQLAWVDALRFDAFSDAIEVPAAFPPQEGREEIVYRRLRDPVDILATTEYFQSHGYPKANKGVVLDAITRIAYEHEYHPVRDYLHGLTWDGTKRVERLFQHYFKADVPKQPERPELDKEGHTLPTEADQRVKYLEQISISFMVGAVARIEDPGCKHDHSPVVVSDLQGMLKSTGIRLLCPDPDWFTDNLPPDLSDRDTKESLRGKWIIELSEIPHVRKDAERLKAFMSTQRDRYRSAYGMASQDYPRQCVFIGTSNDLEFADATGNRRFWPFHIVEPVDTDSIKADRDQLWAEALHLYRSGTEWWLKPNIEKIAAKQQADFTQGDLWEDLIAAWIRSHAPGEEPELTMKDLFAKDTGITPYRETSAVSKADEMRAGRCLTRLGWHKRRITVDGDRVMLWRPKPAPKPA